MTYFIVAVSGLVVGFLAGVVFRDALDLYRSARKERRMSPTRNHTLNRWLLTIAIVANGVTAGFLIYQRAESAEFTRCTAEWQTDFYEAYQPRSQAVANTLGALDVVVSSVAKRDQTEFDAALTNYQELRQQQIADRKANPLPELPETACGGSK